MSTKQLNVKIIESKLSLLEPGQFFKFKGGQTAKYRMPGTQLLSDLSTNDHMMFIVLRKSEQHIMCKSGVIDYHFRFTGYSTAPGTCANTKKNMSSYTGADCEVIIV